MLPSPIRWAGGKSRLRKSIIPIIPANHSRYVEPFAGAAWVLFGKPRSKKEVLNDIDPELTTFYRVLRDQHEELIDSFQWALVSRSEFQRLAALDTQDLTDLQRAHRFFYLTMACWGGESAYPRFQTGIKDAGHGNRLIGALLRLRERLEPAQQRLRDVTILNLDWQECIQHYDNPDTFLYLDPPYLRNGVNYRFNMRTKPEHQKLAHQLRKSQSSWILSAYDNQEVRSMFEGFHIIPVSSASGMQTSQAEQKAGRNRTTNTEVLVTNFDPPATPGAAIPRHGNTAPHRTKTLQQQLTLAL